MFRNTLILITLLALSFGLGQDVQTTNSTNPIVRLTQFIDQVSSSEEHLLHKERVGPYIVNADGQRLMEHPYLKFDITKDGEALSDSATVTMESTFFVYKTNPVNKSYNAVRDGDIFVVDPLDLSALNEVDHTYGGEMEFNLVISEGGETAQKRFEIDYYPPRPEVGFVFRLLNTLIPIVVLVLALILFRIRGLERNQMVPSKV